MDDEETTVKHLPTRHNQKEHGRTKDKFDEVEISGGSKELKKTVSDFMKRAGIRGDTVRVVSFETKTEMAALSEQSGSLREGYRADVLGFFSRLGRVVRIMPQKSKIDFSITLAHEVGHAIDDRYPSMKAKFFQYMNNSSEGRTELTKVRHSLRIAGYTKESTDSELFASFYAISMADSEYQSYFKKAVSFFSERNA